MIDEESFARFSALSQRPPHADEWRSICEELASADLSAAETDRLAKAFDHWPEATRILAPRDDAHAAKLFAGAAGALSRAFHLHGVVARRSFEALASPPLAASVRELELVQPPDSPDAPIRVLSSLPAFPALRRLGVTATGEEELLLASTLEALARWQLPELEELSLCASECAEDARLVALATATYWPRLRALVLFGPLLHAADARVFHDSTAPHLAELWLERGDPEVIMDVLRAPSFDGLERLDLLRCHLDGPAISALAPRLTRVRSLNLTGNPIGDEGAEALARLELPALTELTLSGCWFGQRGAEALARWPGLSQLKRLGLAPARAPARRGEAAGGDNAEAVQIVASSPKLGEGVVVRPPGAPRAPAQQETALPPPKKPWWKRLFAAD